MPLTPSARIFRTETLTGSMNASTCRLPVPVFTMRYVRAFDAVKRLLLVEKQAPSSPKSSTRAAGGLASNARSPWSCFRRVLPSEVCWPVSRTGLSPARPPA